MEIIEQNIMETSIKEENLDKRERTHRIGIVFVSCCFNIHEPQLCKTQLIYLSLTSSLLNKTLNMVS